MSRALDIMSRLNPKYVKVTSHMLMFGITYVIVSIAYIKIGHQPSLKVSYEIFNLCYF